MDHLWSPWRYRYVTNAGSGGDTSSEPSGCIFCTKPGPATQEGLSPAEAAALQAANDDENFIVYRGQRNFILLNLYPYTNGHMMIAPYEHVSRMNDAHPEAMAEMMRLAVRCEKALTDLYKPHGINMGMNLGEAAGAGVAGHIHMHMLPRWRGDASFMTTVAETRVLPEDLTTTYQRLKSALAGN